MSSVWEPKAGEFRSTNEWAMLLVVVATLAIPVVFDSGFLPSFLGSVFVLGTCVATGFWDPRKDGTSFIQVLWCVFCGFAFVWVLYAIHRFAYPSPSVPVSSFCALIASVGWTIPDAKSRRLLVLMAYLPLTFFLCMALVSVVPQGQHEWVWLVFVGAGAAVAMVVGVAGPSGQRFEGRSSRSSVWALGRGLVVVVVASMVLSVPVSAVRMKMKSPAFASFEGAPALSASSSVVMTAAFKGAVPENPYWRGMDLVYPTPSNVYGDWDSYKTVFDDILPREEVRPVAGEKQRAVYSEETLRSQANYSFVLTADSASAAFVELDGTVSRERSKRDGKEILLEYDSWGYESFRRRPWEWDIGVGLGFSSSAEAAFFEKLNRGMDVYLTIPGFDPSQGKVPEEVVQTYALVKKIQADLVASGQIKSVGLTHQSEASERQAFAKAVTDYFSQHLRYNFDHQFTEKEKNTVDFLLFEDQRGVCRHFANAFAMAMRMGGVPSRVVAGFAGGAYNKDTQTYLVRERDAHAWTEVWMGWDQGWVRVDPTASIPVEKGIPESGVVAQWKEGMRFSKSVFAGFATAGKGESLSASRVSQGLSSLREWANPWLRWLLAVGALSVAVLLGLFVLRLRERWLAQCPTQKAWAALLGMVRGFGHEVPANMGPATLKAVLADRLHGEALARWVEAVDGYEQWRFANANPTGLAHTIRRAIPVVRRALHQEKRRGG